MPVEIDIARVARLARLALSDEDLARYEQQLGAVLEHAALVQALPTEGVEPTSHPLPLPTPFRPDVAGPSLDREEVLAAAPDRDGSYFLTPRILEEG